jgi:hypothetical protein
MLQKKQPNKALHSDKIKLRSFLATPYFAGELGRYSARSIQRFGFSYWRSHVNTASSGTHHGNVPPSLTSNASFEHTPFAMLGAVLNSNTLGVVIRQRNES